MPSSPIVRVQQGELQGRVDTTPNGNAFYSFQGIPYAKPPIGSLRFRDPQPPEPWQGVLDATNLGNSCAQFDSLFFKKYYGDENCLFLNVYTPNLNGESLPVMVFIHGGGYRYGSSDTHLYGPDYLVEKDVVLVTINYRLGPLGFLCLNTPEVPGNAGLKDAVQALRWIKENIKSFGGDSSNITIFGESAGGTMVSLLVASPMSKNMISKAIIQSGAALNTWAYQYKPIENVVDLASALGCQSNDLNNVLEFLTTTPVKDLVETNENIASMMHYFTKGKESFGPVVEKEFSGVEAFLTEPYIDILTSGRVANVPIMIGTTSLEGALILDSDDLQTYIPSELHIEKNSAESLAIAEQIKQLYFKAHSSGIEKEIEKFQLMSDVTFNVGAHRQIEYLVNNSNVPIYYYKFDYTGELNVSSNFFKSPGTKFAGHMDELGYLFKNEFQNNVEPMPQDIKMRERMVRLWTNFAKFGNPTPDQSHFLSVTWLPVTKDILYYLNLGNELHLDSNPDKEKMEFWSELFRKYYRIWDHPKFQEINATNLIIGSNNGPIHQVEYTPGGSAPIHQVEFIPGGSAPIHQVEFIPGGSAPIHQVEHVPAGGAPIHQVEHVPAEVPPTAVHFVDHPIEIIRANDPPEDDLPKNVGVNKFVNFFESLGGKK